MGSPLIRRRRHRSCGASGAQRRPGEASLDLMGKTWENAWKTWEKQRKSPWHRKNILEKLRQNPWNQRNMLENLEKIPGIGETCWKNIGKSMKIVCKWRFLAGKSRWNRWICSAFNWTKWDFTGFNLDHSRFWEAGLSPFNHGKSQSSGGSLLDDLQDRCGIGWSDDHAKDHPQVRGCHEIRFVPHALNGFMQNDSQTWYQQEWLSTGSAHDSYLVSANYQSLS